MMRRLQDLDKDPSYQKVSEVLLWGSSGLFSGRFNIGKEQDIEVILISVMVTYRVTQRLEKKASAASSPWGNLHSASH